MSYNRESLIKYDNINSQALLKYWVKYNKTLVVNHVKYEATTKQLLGTKVKQDSYITASHQQPITAKLWQLLQTIFTFYNTRTVLLVHTMRTTMTNPRCRSPHPHQPAPSDAQNQMDRHQCFQWQHLALANLTDGQYTLLPP